jgi:putative hemolysin
MATKNSIKYPGVRPRLSSHLVGDRQLITPPGHTSYCCRIATAPQDIAAAQRLRYEIFNLELKEGLTSSLSTGRDADAYDEVFDHLIVQEMQGGTIVGTYRLQPGVRACAGAGFYSSQEFDLTPFFDLTDQLVELGRACVHKDHRHLSVLRLMWQGIWTYARARGARYLVGCSSLSSQDPSHGASVFEQLKDRCLAPPAFRVAPLSQLACPLVPPCQPHYRIPKLLRAYLSVGAWICGPPAIDREFGTIDFLTLFDLNILEARIAGLTEPVS